MFFKTEKIEDKNPFAPPDKEDWINERKFEVNIKTNNIPSCSGVFITDYWIPKNDKVKRREEC